MAFVKMRRIVALAMGISDLGWDYSAGEMPVGGCRAGNNTSRMMPPCSIMTPLEVTRCNACVPPIKSPTLNAMAGKSSTDNNATPSFSPPGAVTPTTVIFVAVVDTAVANHLIRMTKAARLMGCESIVSGLSPSVARTIVELGIEVGDMRTTGTLQDALSIAFKRVGTVGEIEQL